MFQPKVQHGFEPYGTVEVAVQVDEGEMRVDQGKILRVVEQAGMILQSGR
ncbi:MAG: hypothetical protein LLG42_11700 [Chloroflexi bacterium]|nr:hypothetical protein [Chloroflexota bacterium]